MQILVDADACPVTAIVENIAKKNRIPCVLLCDTNHYLQSDYSEVVLVSAGVDAVDFALVGRCKKGDIVITQDYGVAAMVLGKGAAAIHQSGQWYTQENIDQLLMTRHITKKERNKRGKTHLKGPKKRTAKDDIRFEKSLETLIAKM